PNRGPIATRASYRSRRTAARSSSSPRASRPRGHACRAATSCATRRGGGARASSRIRSRRRARSTGSASPTTRATDNRESMTREAVDAARRLAHDVGKYVRLGAPQTPERDAGELRERLSRDLKETRRAGGRTESVLEVYAAWRREDAGALGAEPLLAPRLVDVDAAIAEIASLLPRLDALDESGLRSLDAASLLLSRCCRE